MAIVIQVVRSGPTYGMARGSMRQTFPQQAGTHLFEFYISIHYILEQTQENYGGQGQPASMLESDFPRVVARCSSNGLEVRILVAMECCGREDVWNAPVK